MTAASTAIRPIRGWILPELIAVWPMAAEAAKHAGFLLTVYGSVLKVGSPNLYHQARDLDLIAVPWRPHASEHALANMLYAYLMWEEVGVWETSAMGAKTAQFQDRDGRVIDLQVRL